MGVKIITVLALGISACSPLSSDATAKLFESLKERSSCVLIGGGAGGLTIGPGAIPGAGGYGYAWVAKAMPEHSVEVTSEGCKITNNKIP